MSERGNACIIVRNVFTHDARNERMARALRDEGFRVTVLAPLLDRSLPTVEDREGFRLERIDAVGNAYRFLRSAGGEAAQPAAATGGNKGSSLRSSFRRVAGPAGRTYFAARFAQKAGARAAALRPKLYQACHPNALAAAVVAARKHAAPILYDSQELYAHQNVPNPTRSRRAGVERLESSLLRKTDAVITVCESIAVELQKAYEIARPKVVMNIPEISPSDEPVLIPDALSVEGTKLLSVGGITHGRGLEQSIAALRHLPDARLIIMGPSVPPFDRPIRAAAAAPDVADRVAFVEPVAPHAVVPVSSHATVALVTIENVSLSYYYALPNKLFESLHAGLPVVASNFPEMSRIVNRYGAGVTCDPADPESIAAAVREVTRDAESLERFRAGARAAAKDLTWENERREYLDVVRSLVSPAAQ